MSKLRTNQLETLDGLNTKSVATLVDDINNAEITTSTGVDQLLAEALDLRTIYVGSVVELEALSLEEGASVELTDTGVAGTGVIKVGSPPADPLKGKYVVIANGNYWERDTKGILYPQFFGSGGADDQAAIEACRDMCITTGDALGLYGTYSYSTAPNLAADYLKIQPLGEVVFQHTGTGSAFLMDAGSGSELVFGMEMTGPIIIEGNTNSTVPILRALIQCDIDLEIREITGTAFDVIFGVLTRYKLACSINRNPMTLTPSTGVAIKARNGSATAACIFDNLSFEGLSGTGYGIDIVEGGANTFLGGTSEGNAGGGVRVRIDSIRNTFLKTFCEANGGIDWDILGPDTEMIGCTGSSAIDSLRANCQSFLAQSCTFRQINIIGGDKIHLDNCVYLDTFSDPNIVATHRALRIGPISGAFSYVPDRLYLINTSTPTFQNGWGNYGSGDAGARFYRTGNGTIKLEGTIFGGTIGSAAFTLPAGFRPAGGIILAVCAGVSSTDVVNVEIRLNGDVVPVSGSNARVSLNTVEFRTELS